jgi:hypothetical protein
MGVIYCGLVDEKGEGVSKRKRREYESVYEF